MRSLLRAAMRLAVMPVAVLPVVVVAFARVEA